jgi:hypothetical protein
MREFRSKGHIYKIEKVLGQGQSATVFKAYGQECIGSLGLAGQSGTGETAVQLASGEVVSLTERDFERQAASRRR